LLFVFRVEVYKEAGIQLLLEKGALLLHVSMLVSAASRALRCLNFLRGVLSGRHLIHEDRMKLFELLALRKRFPRNGVGP
jgi:ABC-type histidine transport system ATPase subunit